MIGRDSDSDAVGNSLRQQVRVRHHKFGVPLFNPSGNFLQLLLKAGNGGLGGSFNKQVFRVVANEFLLEQMFCILKKDQHRYLSLQKIRAGNFVKLYSISPSPDVATKNQMRAMTKMSCDYYL